MRLDREQEARFFAGAEEATRFFLGESDVQRALEKVVRLLEEDGIPGRLEDAAGSSGPAAHLPGRFMSRGNVPTAEKTLQQLPRPFFSLKNARGAFRERCGS